MIKRHRVANLLSILIIVAFLVSSGAVSCGPTAGPPPGGPPPVEPGPGGPAPGEQPPGGPPPVGPTPGAPPPGEAQITFTADRMAVQAGECANLQWTVQGGFAVQMNLQPVQATGQMQVCPQETTSY
ncbi:MAG: hypothetical protein MUP64_09485, partial [Anaerolineae bacterium]|nr:hypothetical protein [Anaerolineae bacterium]